MRKLIFLLLFWNLGAQAQLVVESGWYPEKVLQANLQRAKSPDEQIRATGILALHYKWQKLNDSLASLYIDKIYDIAKASKQKSLMAAALWWDAYSSSEVLLTLHEESQMAIDKANQLLQYAQENNLPKEKIAANLLLTDINIHYNLGLAEKQALAAKQWLESWKVDSTFKDSLKLEVYRRLAHVYIHKSDGVNIAHYVLAVQDYAEQDRNQALKIQAIYHLGNIYGHWQGQERRSLLWWKKLYDYHLKKKQPYHLLYATRFLASAYGRIGKKDSANYYYNELGKLRDSLGVYTIGMYLGNSNRLSLGLITTEQAIQALDNHFNGRVFLPPAIAYQAKAQIFLQANQLDSAGLYLAKAKKNGIEALNPVAYRYKFLLGQYYLKTKDYNKAILIFNEFKKEGKTKGDLSMVQLTLENLSNAYKGKRDYKTAFKYLDQYYKLKDSLDNLGNNEEVAFLQVQKEREMQQVAYTQLKRAKEVEQARIAYRNQVRVSALVAGIFVLFSIAALLWRNNRNKQKAYIQLQHQKAKTEKAFQDLKEAQAQLIQSEKMAYLGELTAGIAHEIQNPLNFVNNFSEVNTELIDELQVEIKAGNTEDALSISNDIKENEQKIKQHGQRADIIVKGMLQHSRTNTGEKQLTDINALAEEYLRLAYHGLRAKDKDFNAHLITDFDSRIGKIEVVPQDLGRVFLNLFNNAFYATQQKKDQLKDRYLPEVKVTTCGLNGQVEIKVCDNGTGMPEGIKSKIFQPFFTTKPAGQGTGLGLSLTYDIITKEHSGTIDLNTQEGEFSEFILRIPRNNG